MLQTEDGRLIFDEISEDGRVAIEHTILENGLMLYGDADIISSDEGIGADAIVEQLAALIEAETGSGAEEGIIGLSGSDVGVGADELANLIASITESDLGSGAETETIVISLYLLLKLLQKKKLNILISQNKKKLNILISQDKKLNLKRSQEQN